MARLEERSEETTADSVRCEESEAHSVPEHEYRLERVVVVCRHWVCLSGL